MHEIDKRIRQLELFIVKQSFQVIINFATSCSLKFLQYKVTIFFLIVQV